MTDLEINKALALKIGWKPKQIGTWVMDRGGRHEFHYITCNNRPFSYLDPCVIWPIAEAYNRFPYATRDIDGKYTGKWVVRDDIDKEYRAYSAAKAVALAVIGAKS